VIRRAIVGSMRSLSSHSKVSSSSSGAAMITWSNIRTILRGSLARIDWIPLRST
jgi:hypothetical protein